MKRVLVGADGSDGGRAAVAWAQALTAATDAEMVVARAWHPRFAEVPPDVHDRLRAESAAALAEEWSDAPGRVRATLVDGDPRRGLLDLAEQEDVDLVVVGARRTHGAAHLPHLGSVTHYLAHHASRPVAAVPPDPPTPLTGPIVVGVDGSEGGARAARWSRDVAVALQVPVVGVYAEEPAQELRPYWNYEQWRADASPRCSAWMSEVRDAGIETRTVVVAGDTAGALGRVAADEHASMLVVGARGRGELSELRVGSTALRVLHHGSRPVVVVP